MAQSGLFQTISESESDVGTYQGVLQAVDGGQLTVPGESWLLKADFSPQGGDLLLTGPDGVQVLIRDFFNLDNPPDLLTDAGAMISAELASKLAGPVAPGQLALVDGNPFSELAQAADSIGRVEATDGLVEAIRIDGTKVTLTKGDDIFQGDTLVTAKGAAIGITFVDDTTFSLGEEGRMVIDEMVYDAETQEGQFSANLVQGVFSFVSGEIAKTSPEGMTVSTPVATIGIRGTKVAGRAAQEGAENTISLLPETDAQGNQIVGELSVTNQGGTVTLNAVGATVQMSSAFQAPPPPVTFNPQQIQQNFGSTLTTLSTAAAAASEADASETAAEAEAAQAEAEQAGAEAEAAAADAEAAKAEAEQAQADAEASGDPEAIAAAEAKAAEAEAKAAEAEVKVAEAEVKAAEAEAKTAEAEVAQAEAEHANAEMQTQAQAFQAFGGPTTGTAGGNDAPALDSGPAPGNNDAPAGGDQLVDNGGDTFDGDSLFGGAGNELFGGAGNDLVGLDEGPLFTGNGDDTFIFTPLPPPPDVVVVQVQETQTTTTTETTTTTTTAGSHAAKLNIGYYDMSLGTGDNSGAGEQVSMITANGHTATQVSNLTAADLSGIDVLVVQIPSTYTSEYTANMSAIQTAVSNGMVMLLHDRAVSSAETILPGSTGFSFSSASGSDLNVDAGAIYSVMAEGPSGRIVNTSLDNGSASHHGYMSSSLLPADATALLNTGTTTNIADFSYAYGNGAVVYSTIPLDCYLGGGGCYSSQPNLADVYAPNIVQYAAALALEGFATLTGTATGEVVAGTANADTIRAGDGNDTVYGLAGNDTLSGEGGNDTLMGGTGDDVIDGGAGTDSASYAHAVSAVSASLATGVASGGDGTDTLANVENLTGSAYNDTLTGDSGTNSLKGGKGNDTINGVSGTDTAALSGAKANYTYAFAGNGDLTLTDSTTTDGVDTISNIDTLTFSDGSVGITSTKTITGDAGVDTITATDATSISTGAGNDVITVSGTTAATLDGGTGTDLIYLAGSSAAQTVRFTTSSDGATTTDSVLGRDQIFGFTEGTDKIGISGSLASLIDDGGAADGVITWASNAAVDFTGTQEALFVYDSSDYAGYTGQGGFPNLLSAVINGIGMTSNVGDDGLIVASATGASANGGAGIFYFQENGTTLNNVTADELTYIASIEVTPVSATITADVVIV